MLVQLGQLGFVLPIGLFCGTQPIIMVEEPRRDPLHGGGAGYNDPRRDRRLEPAGGDLAGAAHRRRPRPAYLIMAAAAVSFIAALGFRERSRLPLDQAVSPASAVSRPGQPELDVGVDDQLAEQGPLGLQPSAELGR